MPGSKSPKQPHILCPPPERVAITLDQAPIEARPRYENAEKWIAWASDRQSIIAADKDFEVVVEAARLAGFPTPRFEWVPPVNGPIWE